jgi:hypothetical protein
MCRGRLPREIVERTPLSADSVGLTIVGILDTSAMQAKDLIIAYA